MYWTMRADIRSTGGIKVVGTVTIRFPAASFDQAELLGRHLLSEEALNWQVEVTGLERYYPWPGEFDGGRGEDEEVGEETVG